MNKILFIYKYYSYGGTESAIKNRIIGLMKKGIQADCLFLTKKSDGIFENEKNIYFFDIDNIKQLNYVLESDYSVISIIDTPEVYPYIRQIKINRNFIVINECHTSNIEYLKYVENIDSDNLIDAFIVPSFFSKNLLLNSYNIKTPIYVVNNCIDSENFFYYREDFDLHFFEDIDKNIPILCWIGRLEDSKNPLDFLKIVKFLKSKYSIKAWIIGGNRYSHLINEIQNQINRLNLINTIRWYPSLPYSLMPFVYSAISYSGGCLVSTSERECYPMIFLEAISCKCPVVCTNVGGNSEIIKDNLTGIIYEPRDINKALYSIEKVITENNFRTEIIKNALKLVKTQNNIEKCADDFLNVISKISI